MLTRSLELPAAPLRRPAAEPGMPALRLCLRAHARSIVKAFVVATAVLLALSMIVFLRVVLSAHLLPRWQEDLAQILPFLD